MKATKLYCVESRSTGLRLQSVNGKGDSALFTSCKIGRKAVGRKGKTGGVRAPRRGFMVLDRQAAYTIAAIMTLNRMGVVVRVVK